MTTEQQFQQTVLAWYDQFGRKHLPWQKNKTAYKVWISEVMLQQTQVGTVIPYFERFMRHFPQVSDLAAADLDEVLHLWTGLGYYSRARNLHRAARMLMTEFAGKFPDNRDALQKLPGIGRSTAAAILSLAFNQPAAILDGNVKRLLSRYCGISDPINDSKTEKQLWTLAEQFVPRQRVADYTQVLMDLGAMICVRRQPLCSACPIATTCVAFQTGQQQQIPYKKPRKKLPTRTTIMLVLQGPQQQILLQKRPMTGIWGGLWSFPEYQNEFDGDIALFCQQHFAVTPMLIEPLTAFRHTFSHFHLQVTPLLIKIDQLPTQIMASETMLWYDSSNKQTIGLPQPVKRLLEKLKL
ncbi:MAG: A/G-specific adenine glycosylase [Pseudomonadota bacterium]